MCLVHHYHKLPRQPKCLFKTKTNLASMLTSILKSLNPDQAVRVKGYFYTSKKKKEPWGNIIS